MAADSTPASYAQRALWFLHRWNGPSATYNMPFALRLSGAPDEPALGRALADLAGRHDILRTVIAAADDEPCQRVEAAWRGGLTVVDVAGHELDERVRAAVARPYDMEKEPPWGVWLFRVAGGAPVLLFVLHHVLADQWSFQVLARDLDTAYRARRAGRAPQWAARAAQYGDYTRHQRELLGDKDDPGSLTAREIAHWRQALDGLPERIPLPSDHADPSDRPKSSDRTGPFDRAKPFDRADSFDRSEPLDGSGNEAGEAGADVPFALPPATAAALRELARRGKASPFMVLQAAVAALLHRLGGGDDIPLGVAVSGRDDPRWDDLVGLLVNATILRADLSGRPTLRELLARVRERGLRAYGHHVLPFDRLVDGLNPARSPGHNPLFQVMTVYEKADGRALPLDDLRGEVIPVPAESAKFDLTFAFVDHADGPLEGVLNVATARLGPAAAKTLAERLVRLVERAVADPDLPLHRIDLLTPAERDDRLAQGPPHRVEEPQTWVTRQFAGWARTHPERPAAGDLTYGELDRRSDLLARRLAELGAGPESVVALPLPEGEWSLVGALAALKAGAAFLPLHPGHPPARNAAVLADAGARLAITAAGSPPLPADVKTVRADLPDDAEVGADLPDEAAARADLPDGEAVRAGSLGGEAATLPVRAQPHPDQAAYVIYTSGSTGRPKGVVVSRAALAAYLSWAVERYPGLAGTALLSGPLTSDLNLTSALGPLTAGGRVVTGEFGTPVEGLTFAKCTPSHLALLEGDALGGAHTLVVGGEALTGAHLRAWQTSRSGAGARTAVNEYGPTEATVGCVLHELTDTGDLPAGTVPIGVPAPGCSAHLLDETLRPVPPGVTGELYLGGDQLARGYLGRPGLTASRFVASPFVPGERLYRSGDLARRRADGLLDYLGRSDDQLKILGNRIEPAEVEAVLAAHEDVAQAAVAARRSAPGGRERLIAYVVSRSGDLDPERVRAHAVRLLPQAMVPAAVMVLDSLPLTRAGKLDRAALPAPSPQAPSPAAGGAAERRLCLLFGEVLGLERVGPDDGFFALGGDSIAAIRLVGRARAAGLRFTARDVFVHQSARALLTAARDDDHPARAEEPSSGEVPLTPILAELLERGGPLTGYTQARVVNLPADVTPAILSAAVQALLDTHDALRSRLLPPGEDGGWRHVIREPGQVRAEHVLVTHADEQRMSQRLDPVAGEVAAVAPLDPRTLLVAVHHLAVDAVSWPILLQDLVTACEQRVRGEAGSLPEPGTSLRAWARHLHERAESETGLDAWRDLARDAGAPLGGRPLDPRRDTVGTTRSLLTTTPFDAHDAPARLLLALARAVPRWHPGPEPPLLVEVEGHGREESLLPGADLSRTVGWLTSQYPVSLRLAPGDGRTTLRERLSPARGVEYGLLRHLNPRTAPILAGLPRAQIGFNYWGQDQGSAGQDVVRGNADPALPLPHCLEINAVLREGPTLHTQWTWAAYLLTSSEVGHLAALFQDELRGPADPLIDDLGPAELDRLQREWRHA
ncbi:amino acid adenylation domain-containing protein [Nonomuraea sp. NPDC050790]|uniref:amino acid adenylation domain-containing protein n=1 Tax=Nonomuraea sp. NPDC050790 TaxID=3364371 RepID=UPI0037956ACA